jgi:hypothetical protein
MGFIQLKILAAHPAKASIGLKINTPGATNPEVSFDFPLVSANWSKPAHDLVWISPEPPQQRRRRWKPAGQAHLLWRRKINFIGLFGHALPPFCSVTSRT